MFKWTVLGLILLLVGCGATTPAPAPAPTAEAITPPVTTEAKADFTVQMGTDTGLLKFVPATITARPGQKIRWVMNKAGPHNAVFPTAEQLSQTKLLVKPGDSYVTTIPANQAPGSYDFHCTPHKAAGMVGVLKVQ